MQRRRAATTIGLALFVTLLVSLVAGGHTEDLDAILRSQLLSLDPAGAFAFWRAVSFLGSGLVIAGLTILCVSVLAIRGRREAARRLAFVMLSAVIVENLLKWLVHRVRPIEVFPGTMPASSSFPSGHALFACSLYVTLAMIINRGQTNPFTRAMVWSFTAIIVLLIGASRIFLGVHFPADVVGGFAAALFCICVIDPAPDPKVP